MNLKLIGIHGSIAAGKNVLTQLLDWSAFDIKEPFSQWCNPHQPYKNGKYYQIMAFADPLKAQLAQMTDTSIHLWEDRVFKNAPLKSTKVPHFIRGKTPRELMEEWGEHQRTLYPQIWIDLARKRWDKTKPAIFTDVRHPNEAQFIKDRGGTLLGIKRFQTPSQWVWSLIGEKISLQWKNGLIDIYQFKQYLKDPFKQWVTDGFTEKIITNCLNRLEHQSGKHKLDCDAWINNKGTTTSIQNSLAQILSL